MLILSAMVWNQSVAIVDTARRWEEIGEGVATGMLSKIPLTLTNFSCPIIKLQAESSMEGVMCFIFISQIFFEHHTKAW